MASERLARDAADVSVFAPLKRSRRRLIAYVPLTSRETHLWPYQPLTSHSKPKAVPAMMTKKQAIAEFRETYAPAVRAKYGRGDAVAMREEWSMFTDMLCRDRLITRRQCDAWTNPF